MIISRAASQTLSTPTRLLPHLQKQQPDASPPFVATFTISPSWLKRAGTVALALPGASPASSSSPTSSSDGARRGVLSRDGAGWRPSSLFGALLGGDDGGTAEGAAKSESNDTSGGSDDDGEGGDTLKAEKAAGAAAPPTDTTRSSAGAGGRSRLSALFTDRIAPEASTSAATSTPARPISRIVGEPVALSPDVSRRFSSFTPGERLSALKLQERDEDEDNSGEEEGLEQSLEQLMVRFYRLSP